MKQNETEGRELSDADLERVAAGKGLVPRGSRVVIPLDGRPGPSNPIGGPRPGGARQARGGCPGGNCG